MLLETDHNFALAFFVLIAFVLSWLPVLVVRVIPSTVLSAADSATVDFVFVWLAIGGPSSKLLISLFINQEFRSALGSCISALSPCCCLSTFHQRRLEYRSLSGRGRYGWTTSLSLSLISAFRLHYVANWSKNRWRLGTFLQTISSLMISWSVLLPLSIFQEMCSVLELLPGACGLIAKAAISFLPTALF